MIYSNKYIPRKLTYFNNYLATAAMVPFLSDFFGSFCYSSINRLLDTVLSKHQNLWSSLLANI